MMTRPAAMMKRPAAMMKRPAAADRVADTAPDWLVEPDPTAQLYVCLITAAQLVNGKDETESSGDVRPPPLVGPARLNQDTDFLFQPVKVVSRRRLLMFQWVHHSVLSSFSLQNKARKQAAILN